ncbi:GH32 C-terminal domain-containing protein [Peribacillus frigoritolerans]|uniref:GH32 C-terminal domain-containing protein n=1 Tax=Peribacillus frigoritolerans TaxID=450367 RepID=UPI0035120FA6
MNDLRSSNIYYTYYYMDRSSVERFVNSGEQVMISHIYPKPSCNNPFHLTQ